MNFQNILLLVAALVNIIMSIIVFSRGVRNKVNFYFGLLTFFNFLWAISLVFINLGISYESTRFFAAFVYPVAFMVVVSLFYFVVHFPYKIFEVSNVYNRLIVLFGIFFSFFCILGYRIFVWKVDLYPKVAVYYEFWSYSLFVLVLLVLMGASIVILIFKLKKAEGRFKKQIFLILFPVILGISVGAYFHLFLMYFYILDYNYLGPLFTLVINFVVFYFIFLDKKDNKLV